MFEKSYVLQGTSKGASLVSKAVRATLGPSGRNVVIDPYEKDKHGRMQFGVYPKPLVTKDGVTVA